MTNDQPTLSSRASSMECALLLKMKVINQFTRIFVSVFIVLLLLYWFSGIRGTYQGLTATIMKQGSNQAIRFYVMETCKDWYKGGDPKKPVPKVIVGMFGAVAGAASVFGNTPIDVVKTRMQVCWQAKTPWQVTFDITSLISVGIRSFQVQKHNGLFCPNMEEWRTQSVSELLTNFLF